jgi:5-methylcytosine-specific restriction endonuclease McrA
MGRQARPGGSVYGGRRLKAFAAHVFAVYGRTCHLCGEVGADTVDHLTPRSVSNELAWELSNARPAHRECNSRRKDRPLAAEYHGSGW